MPTASCFIARFQNGTNEDSSPQYIVRPYTPIEDPADGFTGYFDLIVKKYPSKLKLIQPVKCQVIFMV
jgi:cytochrome-b5 reductase